MEVADWTEEQCEAVREQWEYVKAETGSSVYGAVARLLDNLPGVNARITAKQIRLSQSSSQRERFYREHAIPKRRGGERIISAPTHPIKFLQQNFLKVCTALFPRHICAHGFEPERSPQTHASNHTRKNWVWTVDIKDFFPSIHWGRVCGLFQVYPVEATEDVARVLANLTTYNGALPQGAPTSPILSNLVCRRMDSRLFQWARNNGYTYSRYADDLTFSTNRSSFPKEDRAFIKDIIEDEGFQVHPEKERLMPKHTRQMVTGLVVNEKVNVPREFVSGLRALLHNVDRYGWKSQVARQEWLFDSKSEWLRYRNQDLNVEEFRFYKRKQKRQKLLVNPNAVMPKVRDLVRNSELAVGERSTELFREAVKAFKQSVEGRIDYVGQVKGRDSSAYQKLKNWFDYLREFDDEVSRSYREIHGEVSRCIGKYEEKRISRYDALLQRASRDSLDAVKRKVKDLKSETIELKWIAETLAPDEFRREVVEIARRVRASPVLTGCFFQYVNARDGYFKELIHRSGDTDRFSTKELLKRCISVFSVYNTFLPPKLASAINGFLDACKTINRSNPDWHPYNDSDFLKDTVRPFKRSIRFEDGGDGADLIGTIQEQVERLNEERQREGLPPIEADLPRRNLRFNTHTSSVKEAARLIVESVVTNSNQEDVLLRVSLEPVADTGRSNKLQAVRLSIVDKDGYLTAPKPPSELFGGKLKKATKCLRGLAQWTFSYPTESGDSFCSHVLESDQIQTLPTPPSGVKHDLTFFF